MNAFRTRLIGDDGLAVPASLRQALGSRPGDAMVVERHGDGPRIRSEVSALRHIQGPLAPFRLRAGEPAMSEQPIADRRAEAARE